MATSSARAALDASLDDLIASRGSGRGGRGGRGGGGAARGRFAPPRTSAHVAPAWVGGGGAVADDDDGAPSAKKVYVGNLSWKSPWWAIKDHMRGPADAPLAVVNVHIVQDGTGRPSGGAVVEYESEEDAARAIATLHDTELEGRLIFVREDRGSREHGGGGGGGAPPPAAPRGMGGMRGGGAMGFGRGGAMMLPGMMRGPGGTMYIPVPVPMAMAMGMGGMAGMGGMGGMGGFGGGRGGAGFGRGGAAARFAVSLPGGAGGGGGGGGGGGRGEAYDESRGGYYKLMVGGLPWAMEWQDLKDVFKPYGDVTRADVAREKDGTRSAGWGTVEFATAAEAQGAMEALNGAEVGGRVISVRIYT